MRTLAATLAVAITLLLSAATGALAAPVDVRVRIEGASSTIVDRTVRVDGHDVHASSDTQARHCDSTNAHRNPAPGPSATSATVDALASIDQTFDGQWYPGFDDYFITRLGPESEDNNTLWWWGVLVNRLFTPVGGCQLQVHDGDEVLWALDAFSNRPFLWLAGPATAQLGAPLNVAVTSTLSSTDNSQTSGPPYAGARVDAVDANGQPAAAGTADGGLSSADGTATVTFHHPGWQRLKARNPGPGDHPVAIASNSIDVCVEVTPGSGCDGMPPSTKPAVLDGGPSKPASKRVQLGRPRLTLASGRGRTMAAWKVLDAGPGIRDWTIASKTVGRRGARFVARAGGGPSASSALVRLPAGVTSQVRLSVRDTAGHTTSLALGRVLVPRDDRTLTLDADWTRTTDRGAWMSTVTRGGTGAKLTVRLGAGHAALLVRSSRASARVELRAGDRARTYAISAGTAVQTRRLLAPVLASAGSVTLKVLSGTVSVDGVALVD